MYNETCEMQIKQLSGLKSLYIFLVNKVLCYYTVWENDPSIIPNFNLTNSTGLGPILAKYPFSPVHCYVTISTQKFYMISDIVIN